MYKVRTQEIEVIVKQLDKNIKALKSLENGFAFHTKTLNKVNNLIDENEEMSQKLKKEFNI